MVAFDTSACKPLGGYLPQLQFTVVDFKGGSCPQHSHSTCYNFIKNISNILFLNKSII